MMIQSKFLSVSLEDGKLSVTNPSDGLRTELKWPAAALSLSGKRVGSLEPVSDPEEDAGGKTLSQCFKAGDLSMRVSVTLSDKGPWLTKKLSVTAKEPLPTPDYAELDRQAVPDGGLVRRGYTASKPLVFSKPEEEGRGVMPGCGYPLSGARFFCGMEHPAAFASVEKNTDSGAEDYVLTHYPVWSGLNLGGVDAVLGFSADADKALRDYIASIRLPRLKKPLFAMGTFWTDPYTGNYEYYASLDIYTAFVKAFDRLGITPDLYTLDAGWSDRKSFFMPKDSVGGEKGLIKLRKLIEKNGSLMSLWVTHNGPIGIDPDWLTENGFEVGSGNSAAYGGPGFALMTDEKYKAKISEAFERLVKDGAVHLKIDWDNDCAANQSSKEKYPTVNHVRQASLDAFFEIGRKLRELNPSVLIRNGWWPSPWWLREANHVWLSDSGDSEFASLPSRTQRDAAATHRDLMYYNILVRGKTPLPLDCWDNHEMAGAPRNPFRDEPVSWVNSMWLSVARGTTYIAHMLHPESFEKWQAKSFRKIMAFARKHSSVLFTGRSFMFGGHPGKGEIYGFAQESDTGTVLALRNPSAFPRKFKLGELGFLSGRKALAEFYPCFQGRGFQDELIFLPHELKMLIATEEKTELPFAGPYIFDRRAGKAFYRFPASESFSDEIKPLAHPVSRISHFDCLDASAEKTDSGARRHWCVKIPFRMRSAELCLKIKAPSGAGVGVKVFTSRYPRTPMNILPLTYIPAGAPGHGESRNMDYQPWSEGILMSAPLPSGGELYLTLDISSSAEAVPEAWLTGFEAPSREALSDKKEHPLFNSCPPLPHPLGFPRALELQVPSP
jgi:hypothetical protein